MCSRKTNSEFARFVCLFVIVYSKKNRKNSELFFGEIMWCAAQIIAIVFLNPEIVHLKQIIQIPLELILYLHMMK